MPILLPEHRNAETHPIANLSALAQSPNSLGSGIIPVTQASIMHDPEHQPILARPVAPFPARPPHAPGGEGDSPTSPPMARPVEPSPYSPAEVDAGGRPAAYPDCELSRGAAGVDLLLAFGASVGSVIFLGVFVVMLMEAYPAVGVFWESLFIGLISLSVVAVALLARGQHPASIGLNRPLWGRLVAGIALGLPACYVAMFVVGFGYTILEVLGGRDPMEIGEEKMQVIDRLPQVSLVWSTLFALFIGVHEEILFRGFVLTRLCAVFRSKGAGIIASSILFGALHVWQGTAAVFQTAALGLVFALMVTLTRSLWPAILVHGLFDGLQFALMPLIRELLEDLPEVLTTAPAG